MKIPNYKKKQAEKKAKKDLEQLTKDRENCWEEMKPILVKYNLILRGKLQTYDDGIVAMAMLDRTTEKKEPQLATGNTVKTVEVDGEAPGSPAAIAKAMKEKGK